MPQSRPPYTPEFRQQAVELVRTSGRSIRSIASDLGCSDASLGSWVKRAEIDNGKRDSSLTTDERSELTQLRRENRILRQERDILKKATAFFAKESDPR